ncbi:hypothetical protein BC834DRAFT_235931 [Gloeopeniophorella convolvens]|nr:hypothetical protein BC834DRAFT_235931 [Gloeopeniophorella convolvens]
MHSPLSLFSPPNSLRPSFTFFGTPEITALVHDYLYRSSSHMCVVTGARLPSAIRLCGVQFGTMPGHELHAPHPDFLRSLTRHSPQISRLALLSLKDGDALRGLLEMEAPALEELYMGASTITTTSWPNVVLHDPPVPMSRFRLFHRQSPKLRKIYLSNIPVPCAYFPKRTLTHLDIRFWSQARFQGTTGAPQLGTLDGLLDVLATSPCLERLTLDHCLVPASLWPIPLVETVVELPRLHQVYLSGPSSGVLRIFQSLHAPVLRDLALIFVATNQVDVSSWSAIASSVLSRFHRARSVTIETLSLEVCGNYRDTKVDAGGRSSLITPAVPPSPLDETFVSLDFQDRLLVSNHDHYKAIWQEVCAAPHMGELKTISVALYVPTFVTPPWTQLFGQCANVTTVYAGWYGTESLLRSMTPRDPTPSVSSQDPDEPAPALLFPKLTHLILEGPFKRWYNGGECIYQIVFELVERRERCGAPVSELRIWGCDVSSAEVASLKRFVPKVRWGLHS